MQISRPDAARSAASEAVARDADIVALLRCGRQPEAFARLFERYEVLIFRLCRALLRNESAADAAQEAFVRIWRSLHTYDGSAALSTWIYTVARNSCFTSMRREGTRARHFEAFDEDIDLPDEGVEPLDAAATSTVQQAVASLPDRQRTVVQLFYWQDQSVDEVARMLGIPPATVKTLLHRGRQRLAVLLRNQKEALL